MRNIVDGIQTLTGFGFWYLISIKLALIATAFKIIQDAFEKVQRFYRGILNNSRQVTPNGKLVFITGCDSGFGKAAAQRLHNLGYAVFAGCLDAESASQMEDFRVRLDSAQETFRVVRLDVTKQEQVDDAVRAVGEWLDGHQNYRLWSVINNSGVMQAMVPFEFLSIESCRHGFEVNYFGALRVTKAFLPLLRNQLGSRIVITSSIAAEVPPVAFNMASYCATKAATLAVFDILRCEVKKFGIHVSAVCPDFFKTEIANADRIVKAFDAEIDKVPSAVIDEYGGLAYCERIRAAAKGCVSFAKPDLSPVIDSFVAAVSSVHPHRRYFPIDSQSNRLKMMYKVAPSFIDDICARMH